MKMQEYYFETRALCAGYDGQAVVSDVELRLKKGEILTLIGANGAGKTTILKSIIRQLLPISGVAVLDGRNMELLPADELAKEMAVVLTERLLGEMMTVEEVVETGRYPYTGSLGFLSAADHKIVYEAMEKICIVSWKDREFKKLSDGQKQRVMLARALAGQPEIIVLDEPISYLDMKYKLEFLTMLKELSRQSGLTVIMSLHEIELAMLISDKIACFREGLLERFGSPQEIISEQYLLELFGIEPDRVAPEFLEYMKLKIKK